MTDEEPGPRRVELEEMEPLELGKALSIIGEETRARILVALGEAKTTDPSQTNALGYAALMDRVDVADSGRFNYHLDKLVGTFIKKREEGYSLRLPGQLVYEAIIAGTFTDRESIDPFEVGDCPECAEPLTAAYHPDHLLTVECVACQRLYDAMHVPARGVRDRSPEALLDAAYRRRFHEVAAMLGGVCPSCASAVDRRLADAAAITYGSGSVDEMAGLETYAVLECHACHNGLVGHPANVAVATPAVVGFFADQGRDAAVERWWEEPIASARRDTDLIQEEPRAVAIPFAIAEERLRLVLDAHLAVTASRS